MSNDLTVKKQDRRLLSWGIALLCCTVIFIAIEIRYPYFFMRDDNADSYLAEYMYGIRAISEGKFPLFSFNTFGGQRFFAEGQVGVLNPLVYFSAMASSLICGKPDMMIDILAFVSIIIGCTGAFFLLKKLGCTDLPAIIGAIAWNFNAYNIWEGSSWIIVIYTTSVFPFFLLTSLLLLEKSSIRNLILAVIPRVYMFYLGHPQFFIFAAIFDCIFIGVLCLVRSKGTRIHSLLMLIKDYLIVYISTTFLSLPLLIPEYQYTLLTHSNGSARTYENLLLEMWLDKPAFFVPFLYTEDNFGNFYPPFIGYLLIAFALIGIFLLIFMFQEKAYKKYRELGKVMIAALPCLLIGYLLLFSRDALKVIWYIPILNRFQYYHRICIFFAAFAIIFATMTMTTVLSRIKSKYKIKDNVALAVSAVIVAVEFTTFGCLFTLAPHMGRGPLYDTSELYNYEFASQLTGGRYICVGNPVDPTSVNNTKRDLSENLNYNLAKLYNIDNISGYAGVLNYKYIIENNPFIGHMNVIEGSLYNYYSGMVEELRDHSVCWYIVAKNCREKYESHFKNYGLEYYTETDYSVVYYDSNAEPYAYDFNGNSVSVFQDVNSLILNTDSSFPGGNITLNYAYDPNFKCYVDGTPVAITEDTANWQFKVECPPGEHRVVIQYEDFTFFMCCVIAAEYVLFAGVVIVVYGKIQKRKKAEQA